VKRTLRLNEFKELYKAVKTGLVWLDYLLFSFVYWLEEKVIENRSQQVVDEAIKEYETLHEQSMPDMVTPVYTENPSDTSTSLPEMRLTAPWYDDTYGEK
jgi:TPP-dependent pyruvate/acetoin dehydrogenase alpha subunit